jgi:hypothetical protein
MTTKLEAGLNNETWLKNKLEAELVEVYQQGIMCPIEGPMTKQKHEALSLQQQKEEEAHRAAERSKYKYVNVPLRERVGSAQQWEHITDPVLGYDRNGNFLPEYETELEFRFRQTGILTELNRNLENICSILTFMFKNQIRPK